MITSERKKLGKATRAAGKKFELKVRHDLESKGWIVCKWSNQVEFDDKVTGGPVVKETIEKTIYDASIPMRVERIGKLVGVGHKFNPFTRSFAVGSGFPDFICTRKLPIKNAELFWENTKEISGFDLRVKAEYVDYNILVESKMSKTLDKIEREKVEWIKLNLKIPVLVASKNGRNIKYEQA